MKIAKFIQRDVMFLVRLMGKFDINLSLLGVKD